MNEVLIQLSKVSKTYDNGAVRALEPTDLELKSATSYALCGPSGCGKSTLLHIIATLEPADGGTLHYENRVLGAQGDIAAFRRHFFGLIFQFHYLIPVLTLRENIEMAMLPERKLSYSDMKHTTDMWLERVGLLHRANALIPTLSGGERQRGAVVRALVNNPKVILADEPTGSVDSENARRISRLLHEHVKGQGNTLLLATHDRDLAQSCDVIIKMEDGKIISIIK